MIDSVQPIAEARPLTAFGIIMWSISIYGIILFMVGFPIHLYLGGDGDLDALLLLIALLIVFEYLMRRFYFKRKPTSIYRENADIVVEYYFGLLKKRHEASASRIVQSDKHLVLEKHGKELLRLHKIGYRF